jgi:hypothetical protein
MYQCYGCDEDLTLKVEQEKNRSVGVLHYVTFRRHWKVTVRCDNGHWNTFEGND